jgi:hypothetical protein
VNSFVGLLRASVPKALMGLFNDVVDLLVKDCLAKGRRAS